MRAIGHASVVLGPWLLDWAKYRQFGYFKAAGDKKIGLWRPWGTYFGYLLYDLLPPWNTGRHLTGMLTAVTDVPPRSTLRDTSNGDHVFLRLKFAEKAFSVAAPEHAIGCQQNSS